MLVAFTPSAGTEIANNCIVASAIEYDGAVNYSVLLPFFTVFRMTMIMKHGLLNIAI